MTRHRRYLSVVLLSAPALLPTPWSGTIAIALPEECQPR